MEYVIKITGGEKLLFLRGTVELDGMEISGSRYFGEKSKWPLTENQDEAEKWIDKKAAEAWCAEMWRDPDDLGRIAEVHNAAIPAEYTPQSAAANAEDSSTEDAPKGKKSKKSAAANAEDSST